MLCHFSNKEIRKRLPLSKRYFLNFLKILFGKGKNEYIDFAPWVNNLIVEFEKFEDIELHIIAPHKGLKKFRCEFEMNGIHYHFFRPDSFFPFNSIEFRFCKKKYEEYYHSRFSVKKIIQTIHPDIVNLIAAEQAYYSISILDLEDMPIYVSTQTIYSNPKRRELSSEKIDTIMTEVELRILKKEKYFGCQGRMHRDLLVSYNSNAIVLKQLYPMQRPLNINEVSKKYDFVCFAAGLSKKKGVEDAIDAFAFAKKINSNITLNIVGFCEPNYKRYLIQKIESLGLTEKISFHDYFPVHTDMLQHIKQSKYALLPIKLDVISSTVIEAILLDIPVVTYKTTGTPYLNRNGESVLLADIGDIQALADKMLKLLNSSELAEKLKMNAKAFVNKEYDNKVSAERLVKGYKAVINHYHHGTPIPEELLFDLSEFPIY